MSPRGHGGAGRRKAPRQGECSQMPPSAVSEPLQPPALAASSFQGVGLPLGLGQVERAASKGTKAWVDRIPGHPSCKVFEAPQNELWAAWGAVVPPTGESGLCSDVPMTIGVRRGLGSRPSPVHWTGATAARPGLGWELTNGVPLARPGLSFPSRTLHLLPGSPPHQRALGQEAAPELSAGRKRLRKQVRKNWSRTESHRRAGSRPKAQRCQEAPGTPGQHFSASCPAGHSHTPHPAWPPLQPGSRFPRLSLCTFLRVGALAEEPPGTGFRTPGSAPALPQPAV